MKSVLVILIFLGSIGCPVTQAGDIYYGVSLGHDIPIFHMPINFMDSLSTSLGFNNIWACSSDSLYAERLNSIDALGFDVIPYLTIADSLELKDYFKRYLGAHYMVMQAENDTSDVRFRTKNGSPGGDWYIAPESSQRFIFLDNLYYDHEFAYGSDTIVYQPFIRMRVDEDTIPPDDTLAYLNVWMVNSEWFNEEVRHSYLIKQYPISTNLFRPPFSNPREIEFDSTFTIPDSIIIPLHDTVTDTIAPPRTVVTYQIVSTGRYQFAVDSFAVYNDNGQFIMTNQRANTVFAEFAAGYANKVVSWLLRDDMHYDQLIPARHLDSIIYANTNHTRSGIMKPFYNPFSTYYAYDQPYGGRFTFRDFMRLAHPKKFAPNCYPFWKTTRYYGDYENDSTSVAGLQRRIHNLVTDPMDSIMPFLTADSAELWYGAQAQTEGPYDSVNYDIRRPTGPEMSMEAFVALCYGSKSVWYWPYLTYVGGKQFCGLDSCPLFCDSAEWGHFTNAWYNIRDYVTPNLKALSAYLGDTSMVWVGSYSSHEPQRFHYVSDIHGWSDFYNPDTGWAQIGEFHNGSDKYILLVNRACNIDSVTEAPPQHFVLRFNPSALGLGNYVYITDLIDTVVTYSSTMSDGTIPFTTTLRAGEGRLFKITKAPRHRH